ncbi:MAG: sugar phosphate isomerase/epimerase [Verrucomicrobia bacterium]|nr:sugar phosphate isomerase/epimerase [Verrucomicrobiota bacterium]
MPAKVLLSGFADEGAPRKNVREQMTLLAALGMSYYSIRFVDAGYGVKNVMLLGDEEIATLQQLHRDYGVRVATLGSPIGKVKIKDVDDGTTNRYVPFAQYLEQDVRRAITLAHAFDTKLIRGFSFYPPKGEPPQNYVKQAGDQLGEIAALCEREGVIFGLEVEANLVGQDGYLMMELYRHVASKSLMLIFDAANILCQLGSGKAVVEHYRAMADGLGWMHIKDYRQKGRIEWHGHVNEAMLKNFVPCDEGDCSHLAILKDFAKRIPALERKLKKLGVPGVFLDLEPHLKGGGQFGGFSGPDGFGVALRALTRVLDAARIGYRLRDYKDIEAIKRGT